MVGSAEALDLAAGCISWLTWCAGHCCASWPCKWCNMQLWDEKGYLLPFIQQLISWKFKKRYSNKTELWKKLVYKMSQRIVRCWREVALVTSLWSLPGNLVGRKQSPAKSSENSISEGENHLILRYFSVAKSLKKEKYVKNSSFKKARLFFSLREMGIKSLFLTTVIYSIYIWNVTILMVYHFSYLFQKCIVVVFAVVKLENGP